MPSQSLTPPPSAPSTNASLPAEEFRVAGATELDVVFPSLRRLLVWTASCAPQPFVIGALRASALPPLPPPLPPLSLATVALDARDDSEYDERSSEDDDDSNY
jgi:hypothetical protein